MQSIEFTLNTYAAAFARGDLEAVVENLATPTAIYVGDNLIPLPDRHATLKTLAVYRRNLLSRGYARSSFEVLSTVQPNESTTRVQVMLRNFDMQDTPINAAKAELYLRRFSASDWRLDMISFGAPEQPELLAGMALR